jgi:hypothetical protein
LKFLAIILTLTLAQAVQKASPERYGEFVSKADLVVVAWMTKYGVVAEGKQTNWTVVYRVSEVLKGKHSAETLTLKLDGKSFEKPAKAGDTRGEQDSLLILFLLKGPEQSFSYAGPPLNSPEILASEANLAAVRAAIRQVEGVTTFTWYEISPVGVILLAVFVAAAVCLVFLLRKRRKLADRDSGAGDL